MAAVARKQKTVPNKNEIKGDIDECNNYFNSSTSFSLQMKEECDIYHINLDFESHTSIINVTSSIRYLGRSEELNDLALPVTLDIKLKEPTTYFENGKEENILLKEWDVNITTIEMKRNYLSHSSKVFITVSGTGNWTCFEIIFYFEEIEYRLLSVDPSNALDENSHIAWVTYSPNSVSLLRLYEEPQVKRKGIEIWFYNLDIITEMGEYLLIGTGTEPFKNEYSRSVYVTNATKEYTFYIDYPSAYVAFVSGSVQKAVKRFKILWKGIDAKIDNIPEDPLGVLNSSLICFYNYSAAIQEFEKEKMNRFVAFREDFAAIAKTYLHGEYKAVELDKRSIDLFGNPTKKRVDDSDVLSLLIKVVHGGKSIFTWRTLQSIIEKLVAKDEQVLGYKIVKCPENNEFELPYKDEEWSFVIYAMVPFFGLFVLMTWAWRQKIFAQNCMPEKEEKLSFDPLHAEPNPYVTTTIPKVYRFDDQGRRQTLIQGPLQGESSKETAMIEMNAIPSTSQEPDTLTRFLSSRRSKPRPSIQSLIENPDGNNEQSHVGKTERNESEHLYDSVSSSKQLDETKL